MSFQAQHNHVVNVIVSDSTLLEGHKFDILKKLKKRLHVFYAIRRCLVASTLWVRIPPLIFFIPSFEEAIQLAYGTSDVLYV